ncbi:MAG: hypothetical protein LBV68_06485 [Spirochaetaceae bacterium]|jgi:hypothetical protein|nr:hypothetical protein [Spirochaetaceae bacterium]
MIDKQRYKFLQSARDFPCSVSLGGEAPAWELSRWEGARFKNKLIAPSAKLRFVPDDEDDFSVTSNDRTLLYKGKKQSHRWTILGKDTFEYDVILKREPSSNIISLTLDGAEQFNFYRQPFIGDDPLLHGSYAVYRKDRCIGQGTGKLCHIHRPKIIDAAGRWRWGELFIGGNKLYIKIPQEWLSNARYPVVVDPIVGTQSIGAYKRFFEIEVVTNSYHIPDKIDGLCTAYVYIAENDEGCRPVVYSDSADGPKNRMTMQEQFISGAVNGSKPKGWRSGTFQTQSALQANSQVWFGMYADLCFRPAFDYGGACFHYNFEDFIDDGIPDVLDPMEYYLYEDDYGRLLSMYFEYSLAQNYVRTLTQGVKLSDTIKVQPYFRRMLSVMAHNNSLLNKTGLYNRNILTNGNNQTALENPIEYKREENSECAVNDTTSRLRSCFSFIYDALHIADLFKAGMAFFGNIFDTAQSVASNSRKHGLFHKLETNLKVNDVINNLVGRIRKITTNVHASDYARMPFMFIRKLLDGVASLDEAGHIGDYMRGLSAQAESIAEIKRNLTIIRTQTDDISVHCSLIRRLNIFIKIVTSSFIRDYVIRRFLIARDEIIIKSAVTRELELDSKIR